MFLPFFWSGFQKKTFYKAHQFFGVSISSKNKKCTTSVLQNALFYPLTVPPGLQNLHRSGLYDETWIVTTRPNPIVPKKCIPSLKLTYPLKIDGWKMKFLLGRTIFRGYVSFRECNCSNCLSKKKPWRMVEKLSFFFSKGCFLVVWMNKIFSCWVLFCSLSRKFDDFPAYLFGKKLSSWKKRQNNSWGNIFPCFSCPTESLFLFEVIFYGFIPMVNHPHGI